MSNCCKPVIPTQERKNTLIIVLLLNAIMFLIQFSAAIIGHSTSLLADSLDMLGDALTYGVSLYAIDKSQQWIIRATLFKGIIIFLFAIGIIVEASVKIFFIDTFPHIKIMVIFGGLGLVINGICFYLLSRHRNSDINMRSTWICARNDMIGNVAVLLTSGLVFMLNSRWPDIIIGLLFAVVLIKSSMSIIADARNEGKT